MSVRDFTKRAFFSTLRLGFRLTPMPVATRDRLRQRFFDRHADLVPAGARGQVSLSPFNERRPRIRAIGKAIGFVARDAAILPDPLPATLIAFYLPQFHPIPENDAWWGEGFTEWSNVTRALPQFEGHAQPRLPADLGFYDLRVTDTIRKQMALARNYGIGAFCTYFYWFAGKTLLEQPLQQWLQDPTLDLPICLCWANENWSRRWDGRAGDMLIAQQHSEADDFAFIEHVSRYLKDQRYLRVDGKPLLLVYRPGLLPNPKATAARWRDWCRDHGVGEIALAYVQSFDRVDPRDIGFNAAVEFPPNNLALPTITAQQKLIDPEYRGDVHDWRELVRQSMAQSDPSYPRYSGVNPGWDNEPRRSGAGRVFAHASPRGYRDWLRHAIHTAVRRFPQQPLVFINAWNEWAEGAVLEPDARLGHAWLRATRDALQPAATVPTDARPCAVIHVWYPELLDELVKALRESTLDWRVIITTAHECELAVRDRVAGLKLDAEIEVFENRGRDILPFLHVANRLLDEGVSAVLKLHGKRSTHRQDGDVWRRDLLDKLLSPDRATRIFQAFTQQPSLGIVHAEAHLQPLHYFWGANQANVEYLCRRIGIPMAQVEQDSFVAGSMFWLRPEALRSLLDAHLETSDFESESAQLDGTLAHAIERIFVLTADAEGLTTVSAATLIGAPDTPSRQYPYAQRSG